MPALLTVYRKYRREGLTWPLGAHIMARFGVGFGKRARLGEAAGIGRPRTDGVIIMSNPYVGEIRMFGGNFAPAGWQFCAGQLLPIAENETLFNLIGTTFGGDGESTFGLPDLQGRVPLHQGQGPGLGNYTLGETGGVESVTITTQTMAAHNHPMIATNSAAQLSPANATMATPSGTQAGLRTYSAAAPNTTLNPASILPQGGSQPHDNFMQTLAVSFIISLFGIFPHQ